MVRHTHQALRGSAAPGEDCELGRDGLPGTHHGLMTSRSCKWKNCSLRGQW